MKNWRNTTDTYGLLSIFLHWSIALLFAALIASGLYMTRMADSDSKWFLYSLHKSLGLTTALLIVLRLGSHLVQIAPQISESLQNWEIRLMHSVRFALYLLMILLPISGYLDSVAGGYKTQFFGIDVFRLVEKNQDIAQLALNLHVWSTYVLYLLLALHIGAALKHRFILRDSLFARILP